MVPVGPPGHSRVTSLLSSLNSVPRYRETYLQILEIGTWTSVAGERGQCSGYYTGLYHLFAN